MVNKNELLLKTDSLRGLFREFCPFSQILKNRAMKKSDIHIHKDYGLVFCVFEGNKVIYPLITEMHLPEKYNLDLKAPSAENYLIKKIEYR